MKIIIISINAKKAFDKIQCSFVIKKNTSQLNGYKNDIPHHNKVVNDKSTSNIILNGEKQKVLCLTSGPEQRLLLPLLLNIILEVLTRAVRQEKEIKGVQMERKK